MQNVRIHFEMKQDDSGYPPVGVETLWAHPVRPFGELEAGEFVIDNLPFFAPDVVIDDVVFARLEGGNLYFDRVVARSANSLVRVVLFDDSKIETVRRYLVEMGCTVESLAEHSLLSVGIPPEVELRRVQTYLQAQQVAGLLDYEESVLRQ
jgi:hypothetical protein